MFKLHANISSEDAALNENSYDSVNSNSMFSFSLNSNSSSSPVTSSSFRSIGSLSESSSILSSSSSLNCNRKQTETISNISNQNLIEKVNLS